MSPRLAAIVVVAGLAAAACSAGGSVPDNAVPAVLDVDPTACTVATVDSTDVDVVASGLDWIFGQEFPSSFPAPDLARTRIVPVLDADGIPAIDTPRCLPAGGVGFLADDAPLVVLEVDGDVRAYPLEILTWHELVNDTVGGIPITVSYCPLCNSAVAYDRRVGDRVLDFGTSGALTQSSMVMYDRQTETLWTHFDGRAVAGELTGSRLEFFSTQVVSWADFRERFPDGLVLSRDTGHSRDYGINPYPGYEASDDPLGQFITDTVDPRLGPKDRVVGVELDGEAVAIEHDVLFVAGVSAFELAGQSLVAFNEPGTSSALSGGRVSGGEDVGSSAVFVAEIDEVPLTFRRAGAGFVDDQTRSTWTIFGEAVDGELAGRSLERVPFLDTFWFAWATFHPATTIIPG